MARQEDRRKFAEWQQRLRRFEKSGLTIARFCARERVSVPTFGDGRRKCAGGAASPTAAPAAFKSVEVIGGRAVTLRFPAGAVLDSERTPEPCVPRSARQRFGLVQPRLAMRRRARLTALASARERRSSWR